MYLLFVPKQAEWLQQEISLHIKVTTKTYETLRNTIHFRYTWSSKRRKLRRWAMSLYLCVRARCPSLRCGFSSRYVREVRLRLCTEHIKLRTWDATNKLSWPRDATHRSRLNRRVSPDVMDPPPLHHIILRSSVFSSGGNSSCMFLMGLRVYWKLK